MKRFAAVFCVLLGMLFLPSAALATPATLATGSGGQASGTVIGVGGRTFALEAAGGRMSVVAALAAAADGVTAGDFPYVYGGGPPVVLREQTSLERIFTFQARGHTAITHGLMLGSVVHVGYTVAPNGSLVARSVK